MSQIANPVVDPITESARQGIAIGSQNLNEAANRQTQVGIAAANNATQIKTTQDQLVAQAQEHARYQQFLAGQQTGQQAHDTAMQFSQQTFQAEQEQKHRDFQEKVAARALELDALLKKQSDEMLSAKGDVVAEYYKGMATTKRALNDESARQALLQTRLAGLDPLRDQSAKQFLDALKNQVAATTQQEGFSENSALQAWVGIMSGLAEKPHSTDSNFASLWKNLHTTDGMLNAVSHITSFFGGEHIRSEMDAFSEPGNKDLKVYGKGGSPGRAHDAIKMIGEVLGKDVEGITAGEAAKLAPEAAGRLLMPEFAKQYMTVLASTAGLPQMPTTQQHEASGLAASYLSALHEAQSVAGRDDLDSAAKQAAVNQIMTERVKPAHDKLAAVIGDVQSGSMLRKLAAIASGDMNAEAGTDNEKLAARSMGQGKNEGGRPETEGGMRKKLAEQVMRMQGLASQYGFDTPKKSAEDLDTAARMASKLMNSENDYDSWVKEMVKATPLTAADIEHKFGASIRAYYDQSKEYGGPKKLRELSEATLAKTAGLKNELADLEAKQAQAATGVQKTLLQKQEEERAAKIKALIGAR